MMTLVGPEVGDALDNGGLSPVKIESGGSAGNSMAVWPNSVVVVFFLSSCE